MKNILTACFIFLVLGSCKKSVSELPAATQTGADTFGAKVDGAFWVPKGFGPFPADNLLEALLLPDGSLTINARNFASSPNETEFEIFLKGVTGPGIYVLNTDVSYPSTTASYGYYVKRNLTPQDEWITSALHTGTVTITKLDTVNHFVSGTFSFKGKSLYNTPNELDVAEGRFDVKTD